MNKRIINIILAVVGVALVAWSDDIYNSTGSQIARAFNGQIPIQGH